MNMHSAVFVGRSAESDQWRQWAVDHSPVGVAVLGLDQQVRYANAAMVEVLHGCDGPLFEPDDNGIPGQADRQRLEFAQVLAGERETCRVHRQIRHGGDVRWVSLHVAVITDGFDCPAALVVHATDVTEDLCVQRRTGWLATHDPLTGLVNRARLTERLEDFLSSRRRTSGRTAVLYIDLDGFKQVNDSHGHRAGDDLLVEVGRRIGRVLRAGDVVARMGGDEFVVALADVGPDEVHAIADKVLAVLRGVHGSVTASIGIAIAFAGETPADLLARADLALYEAKGAGKDRSAGAPGVFDLRRLV